MELKIMKILPVIFLGSFLLAGIYTGPAALLFAQGGSGTKQSGAEPKLTAEQARGENLFIQRCALCHLVRKLKFGAPPIKGPILAGVFKGATPVKEKALRELIMKGTPNMPGYQYDFDSKEMDDLISYLKTM